MNKTELLRKALISAGFLSESVGRSLRTIKRSVVKSQNLMSKTFFLQWSMSSHHLRIMPTSSFSTMWQLCTFSIQRLFQCQHQAPAVFSLIVLGVHLQAFVAWIKVDFHLSVAWCNRNKFQRERVFPIKENLWRTKAREDSFQGEEKGKNNWVFTRFLCSIF